ncbi:MAG: hypothetical protein LBW85_13040, partial [Deltaproteobacteria bacterium]|nr:hypothetical protein [Deltaproteobacteria bacterium]
EQHKEAYGTEINYAAVCLSKIYEFINYSHSQRLDIIKKFTKLLLHYGVIYSDTSLNNKINIIDSLNILQEICINIDYDIIFRCFIILCDLNKDNLSYKLLTLKWHKLKCIIKLLPFSDKPIKIFHEDARDTSFIDSIADFVITSPPYINVFNYHQQYRASSEYLNGSVLPSAQAEIGSNRKNRSNRFFTATQYCIDMALVFNELNRICKNNSQIIFIVGRESLVKKTNFRNGEIVTEIACACCNMKLINRQERVFINRYGSNIYEDILYFKSTKQLINSLNKVKKLANILLNNILQYVPQDLKEDLKIAINKIDEIQPSSFYSRIRIK